MSRRRMNAAFKGDFIGRVVLESWSDLRRLVARSTTKLGREIETPLVEEKYGRRRGGGGKRETLRPFRHFRDDGGDGKFT